MERESIFLSYIRLTLKKWAGFQAAIEEGMGGPFAKEKELWLGTEIENYFKLYSDVTPSDVEDYLGAMLENEFDTYFEDGGLLEISKHFCEAYELSLINRTAPIFEEILKKPETTSRPRYSSRQSSQIKGVNTEGSVTDGNEQLVMSQLILSNGTDEEEWTVVSRKSYTRLDGLGNEMK